MDRSKAGEIIDRELPALMDELGIAHWKITVSCEVPSGMSFGAMGECRRRNDYNQGWIDISFDDMKDEEHLLQILRHELFHILLSPFDMFAECADSYTDKESPSRSVMERVWRHSMEKTVVNLERMYGQIEKKHGKGGSREEEAQGQQGEEVHRGTRQGILADRRPEEESRGHDEKERETRAVGG